MLDDLHASHENPLNNLYLKLFRTRPEISFISTGRRKSVARKNSTGCYLAAPIAKHESLFICCAKVAFGIKEFAWSRQVDGLSPIIRNFAFIAAKSASITDILPGLLIEQIHLYCSE